MKAFTYERVNTPAEAALSAQRVPGAKFIAGGTNLLDLMKLEIETPTHLIDVNGLGLDKIEVTDAGTVAKLAMRQPFVLFKGLTFQKLCLPGAFRPGDHHNKMLRPGLCVVHASPQYL